MITLNLKDAPALLKMHPEEVRRRARLGQLPGARPPQRRIFVLEDLAAYLRSLYAAPGRCSVSLRVRTGIEQS